MITKGQECRKQSKCGRPAASARRTAPRHVQARTPVRGGFQGKLVLGRELQLFGPRTAPAAKGAARRPGARRSRAPCTPNSCACMAWTSALLIVRRFWTCQKTLLEASIFLGEQMPFLAYSCLSLGGDAPLPGRGGGVRRAGRGTGSRRPDGGTVPPTPARTSSKRAWYAPSVWASTSDAATAWQLGCFLPDRFSVRMLCN